MSARVLSPLEVAEMLRGLGVQAGLVAVLVPEQVDLWPPPIGVLSLRRRRPTLPPWIGREVLDITCGPAVSTAVVAFWRTS